MSLWCCKKRSSLSSSCVCGRSAIGENNLAEYITAFDAMSEAWTKVTPPVSIKCGKSWPCFVNARFPHPPSRVFCSTNLKSLVAFSFWRVCLD